MKVRFKDAFTVILIKWPKNKYTSTYIYIQCIQKLKVNSLIIEQFFLGNFFTLPSSQKSRDNVLECGYRNIECIYRNIICP